MRAVNSWRSVRVKCNEVWTYVRCLNNAGHSGAHVPGWHLQWLTALRICFMLISPCLCLPCRRSRVTSSLWQSSYHIIERKGISDIWEAATLDKKRYYSITLYFHSLVWIVVICNHLCLVSSNSPFEFWIFLRLDLRDDISMYSFTFRYKERHFIAWIVTVSKRHDGETFPNQNIQTHSTSTAKHNQPAFSKW